MTAFPFPLFARLRLVESLNALKVYWYTWSKLQQLKLSSFSCSFNLFNCWNSQNKKECCLFQQPFPHSKRLPDQKCSHSSLIIRLQLICYTLESLSVANTILFRAKSGMWSSPLTKPQTELQVYRPLHNNYEGKWFIIQICFHGFLRAK